MEDKIIDIRPLSIQDYADLKQSMHEAYGEWPGVWEESQIKKLLRIFPEGQIGISVVIDLCRHVENQGLGMRD